jgi:hypothetical protein
MSWKCSCGMINQGRHEVCVNSSLLSQLGENCLQISANYPDSLMYWDTVFDLLSNPILAILNESRKDNMTPNEELFATYYNRGKILVKDMDDTSLREHHEQLRLIATEAKAQLMASGDEIRERNAKKKLKDKEWLVSIDDEHSVSDLINVPKQRAAKMSKMDKLKKQLESAGLDDATIKEMVSNLERKATNQSLKTVTFTKPVKMDVTKSIQVKSDGDEKPFNPASLKFDK